MLKRYAKEVLLCAGLVCSSLHAVEEPPNVSPDYSQLPPLNLGPDSATGLETTDIIFLVDSSGSLPFGSTGAWALEKQGIINCISGPNAFIPHDGSVAISVIQFSDYPRVEIQLTRIDSPSTAAALISSIEQMEYMNSHTWMSEALKTAVDEFKIRAHGNKRLVILSTDGEPDPNDDIPTLERATDVRTGTGYAAGTLPAMICTVLINLPCDCPSEKTPAQFLRKVANTYDAPAPPTVHGSVHRTFQLRARPDTPNRRMGGAGVYASLFVVCVQRVALG
ncbi:MAG: VWA domain-containing protein [Planctomycetes bacterium]|nr:VWA domain-containing protein [Planctomycetota bacterium]